MNGKAIFLATTLLIALIQYSDSRTIKCNVHNYWQPKQIEGMDLPDANCPGSCYTLKFTIPETSKEFEALRGCSNIEHPDGSETDLYGGRVTYCNTNNCNKGGT